MEGSDETSLRDIADRLSANGFQAYIRHDGTTPLLFALGAKKSHSIDFRRRDNALVIEYWYGHPDDDFISEQVVPTFEAALGPISAWLARDAA
jgi:hypothetical protein